MVSYKGTVSRFGDSDRLLDPPSPSPSRCMELGAAVAEFALESPWRVAIVASSSWSHAFLTDHTWRLHPDHVQDRELFNALRMGDFGVWKKRTLDDTERGGQQELLNWFCLAGAMAQRSTRPEWCELVETHIFNSNKVFAIFPVIVPSKAVPTISA